MLGGKYFPDRMCGAEIMNDTGVLSDPHGVGIVSAVIVQLALWHALVVWYECRVLWPFCNLIETRGDPSLAGGDIHPNLWSYSRFGKSQRREIHSSYRYSVYCTTLKAPPLV